MFHKRFPFFNKVSYLIVDEADENFLNLDEEDPFLGKELPVLPSEITIAISKASEMSAKIGRYFSTVEIPDKGQDVPLEGICSKQTGDLEDNSLKIALLEKCEEESSQQV